MGDKPEWYACEKDADCAIASDVCGWIKGVNYHYRTVFEATVKEKNKVMDCSYQGEIANRNKLKSVCRKNMCEIEGKPIYEGK